ncbi:MAG: DMT family transporter, partial [Alphaproteobacteria bacterium]
MTQKKHYSDEHRHIIGISFMLLNAVAMAVIYAVAKDLTKEISSNMVVFLYKFGILLFALPWCLNEGFKGLKSDRILLHASRGFLSICGSLCLYYAIKHIELVDITAIGYLEQVILVIIGMAYFKEDVSFAKILGISLSFLGAIFIVYPELVDFSSFNLPKFIDPNTQETGFNPYYIFVFLSIGFWATNCTVIKILGKTEKTKVQLFYVLLFSSIISFPMAFLKWQEVTTFMSLPIKTPVEFANIHELGLKVEHIKYIV